MKKVLIIYSGLYNKKNIGGIQTYINKFMEYNEHKFEITLIAGGLKKDFFYNEFNSKVFLVPIKKFLFYIFSFIWHSNLLVLQNKHFKEEFDVIIINRPEDYLSTIFLKAKKKFLLIHGSIRYAYMFWPLPFAFLSDLIERIIFKKITSLFILLKNKENGLSYYLNRYKKADYKIHYLPVPLADYFTNKNYRKNTTSERSEFNAVYWGRLVQSPKNILLILDVIEVVNKLGFHLNITYIGGGEDRDYLLEKIKAKQLEGIAKVKDPIAHDQLPENLMGYDLSFIFSDFEGICLSALESLSLNIPVCAFPVGDIPEYIIEPFNGLIISRDMTLDQIANKIIDYLEKSYKFNINKEVLIPYHSENAFLYINKEIEK